MMLKFLLALLWIAAQQSASTTGSVSGVVKDAGTGKPIAGIGVHIYQANKHAKTEPDGRFSFTDVPAGSFQIMVAEEQKPPIRGRNLTLSAGQNLESLEILIAAPASIAGKVVDEEGEPLAGMQVFAVVKDYFHGRTQYRFVASAATTDKGEYLLDRNINPGRAYLLWVNKQGLRLPAVSDVPANPKLRRRIAAATFYPSSEAPEAAQPVVAGVAEHLQAIDIHVRKEPSFCLEGVLENGNKPDSLQFTIAPTKPASGISSAGGMFTSSPGGKTGPDGKLRICELRPGEYKLTVFDWPKNDLDAVPFYGTSLVTIVDKDVSKVVVTAQSKLTISGEIVWDGEPPEKAEEKQLSIGLQPIDRAMMGRGERPFATSSLPGEFSLPDILADDYRVRVARLPTGYYVKEMTYGPYDALHAVIQAGQGGGLHPKLRAVIARDGATLQTTVVDKDGAPQADISVVLLPDDAASEMQLSAGMVFGETDQRGVYNFTGLRPGKYRVFAVKGEIDEGADRVSKMWLGRENYQKVQLGPKATVPLTLKPQEL